MTSRAVCAELSIVFIILLMARVTILGRAFENIILMAGFTFYFCMFVCQFKRSQIVIKFCVTPIIRIMASRAIRAELTVVFIIFLMTRVTILRRRLQICIAARIEMTFCASHIGAFAIQSKRKTRVGEIAAKSIHAVMAGKTICPESQDVRRSESNIHLTVATIAGI